MEDNNNSVNTDAIIQELQKINESVIGSNQKIDELTEYLIIQDNRKTREAEKAAADQDEENAAAHEQAVQEEQQQQEIVDTYTELLTSINDGVQLTNQLLSVDILIFGIVIGLLFMKIFIDRMIK